MRPAVWCDGVRLLGVALLVSTIPAGGVRAQVSGGVATTDEPLTLSQAVMMTLEGHPLILGGMAREQAAIEGHGAALGERLPLVSLSGSATQFQEPMVVTPIHGFEPSLIPAFDKTLVQAGALMSYTVFDGGARGARISATAAGVNAARSDVTSTRQDLIAQVAESYLGVLLARDQLDAHDQRIAALQSELQRARDNLAVGRAPRVELLRAEAALADAEADRVRTVAMRRVAEGDLGRLVGLPGGALAERSLLDVELAAGPIPDRRLMLERSASDNPGVQSARDNLMVSEAAVGLARGVRRPRVDMQAAYVDRGSLEGDFKAEWNLGLAVSLPVFTGGRLQHGVSRAEALREASREGVRWAELVASAGVDRALAALEEAQARSSSLRLAVDRSVEIARIERLRLDTGTGVQADYLRAEAALLTLRAALSEAEHGAVLARIRLAQAMGELDEHWTIENLGDAS